MNGPRLRPGSGPRITDRGNIEWSTRDLLAGSRRDRHREPTPALKRPESDLPLSQRILCAVIVGIIVAGAVYVSVMCGS